VPPLLLAVRCFWADVAASLLQRRRDLGENEAENEGFIRFKRRRKQEEGRLRRRLKEDYEVSSSFRRPSHCSLFICRSAPPKDGFLCLQTISRLTTPLGRWPWRISTPILAPMRAPTRKQLREHRANPLAPCECESFPFLLFPCFFGPSAMGGSTASFDTTVDGPIHDGRNHGVLRRDHGWAHPGWVEPRRPSTQPWMGPSTMGGNHGVLRRNRGWAHPRWAGTTTSRDAAVNSCTADAFSLTSCAVLFVLFAIEQAGCLRVGSIKDSWTYFGPGVSRFRLIGCPSHSC
jgi:hypothetical protein